MAQIVERRPLGSTGLKVSRLGLAALAIPSGQGSGKLMAADVERAYHEHGINTFLAHTLMKEVCEGVRRLIKAGHRDDLVLVSESGLVPFFGPQRRSIEKHLRLLGTDHLDAWLVGWVRAKWVVRPSVWKGLRKLREEGKVRALGFSTHDRPLGAALARELPADVAMIRYNAAHRGAEREVFGPLSDLKEKRPGFIAYTATRWGMLLNPLPQHGFAQGMTAPECYRFALGNPSVDMCWCAARSLSEVTEDVAGVCAGPLDPEREAEVRRFGDAVHQAAKGGRRWMFGRSAN